MIADDEELRVTLERIARFQAQVSHLRNTETNPTNYRAAVSGYLTETDGARCGPRKRGPIPGQSAQAFDAPCATAA